MRAFTIYLLFPINFLSLIIIHIMIYSHNIYWPYHEACQMLHPKAYTPQVPQKTFEESYYLYCLHSRYYL